MHSCDKKKTTPSDARENDSAANRNTNATALRIIIGSPSYYSCDLDSCKFFCKLAQDVGFLVFIWETKKENGGGGVPVLYLTTLSVSEIVG